MINTIEKRIARLQEAEMVTQRSVYALEKINDSYNFIEKSICSLEEKIDVNNLYNSEPQNMFSFIVKEILAFANKNNLSEDEYENVRAYVDTFAGKDPSNRYIKSINLYIDNNKDYIDNEIDKVFECMNQIIIPGYIVLEGGKLDIANEIDLKEYNENLMIDMVAKKANHINECGLELGKLSAMFRIDNRSKADICKFMKKIMNLNIKPSEVYINEDTVNVFYECKKTCTIRNIEDYSNILSDFVNYINNVDELDLYLDDVNLYEYEESDYIIYDTDIVRFNHEMFNSKLTSVLGKIRSELITVIL
jgi:hypothetical protein